MIKTTPRKHAIKLNCLGIVLILIVVLLAEISEANDVINSEPQYSDIYQYDWNFTLPKDLEVKYFEHTAPKGERYMILDCSDTDKSFLSSFNAKAQSEYIDYFFENMNGILTSEEISEDERIYPSDEFIWCYAFRGQYFENWIDENGLSADSRGVAVLLYKESNQLLYGFSRYSF